MTKTMELLVKDIKTVIITFFYMFQKVKKEHVK